MTWKSHISWKVASNWTSPPVQDIRDISSLLKPNRALNQVSNSKLVTWLSWSDQRLSGKVGDSMNLHNSSTLTPCMIWLNTKRNHRFLYSQMNHQCPVWIIPHLHIRHTWSGSFDAWTPPPFYYFLSNVDITSYTPETQGNLS